MAATGEAADVVWRAAELSELPVSYDPMLSRCEHRQPTWMILMVATPLKVIHVTHDPDVDTKPVTRG